MKGEREREKKREGGKEGDNEEGRKEEKGLLQPNNYNKPKTAPPNHDIIMTSYLFIQGLVVVKERLECLQHLHRRADPRVRRLSLDHCHTQ